jgi:transposase
VVKLRSQIKKGDYIIADRGYSTTSGIHHVESRNAYVIVRVNTSILTMLDFKGDNFSLLEKVQSIKEAGSVKSWDILVPGKKEKFVQGRVCAIRKSNEAIKITHDKLRRNAQKKCHKLKPETLEYAKYIIVFTNYPVDSFSAEEVLEWYRIRWQVELVFKRFKSIAQLGHLPKHSDDSSKAWLYGKLFVALLTNKLMEYATSISPWGYILEECSTSEHMA